MSTGCWPANVPALDVPGSKTSAGRRKSFGFPSADRDERKCLRDQVAFVVCIAKWRNVAAQMFWDELHVVFSVGFREDHSSHRTRRSGLAGPTAGPDYM